jgi:hypothetical protein
MISNDYITGVEERVAQTLGGSRSLDYGDDRQPVVAIDFADGHREIMQVTREREPAGEADVRVIASSKADTLRLCIGKRS